jgi:hypothetical protein
VPPQLLAEQDRAGCISSMNLKDTLRQIQTDFANLSYGRLPQVVFQHLHCGTPRPLGGLPHQILR